jgi:hypothetical protein
MRTCSTELLDIWKENDPVPNLYFDESYLAQLVTTIVANVFDELTLDLASLSRLENCFLVPMLQAQQTLWELSELNFRFELLAPDKRSSANPGDELSRQDLVLRC